MSWESVDHNALGTRTKLLFMAEMTPFTYGGFYDVPRCISLRYRGRRFLLQSAFDDDLDEYPTDYSVYLVLRRLTIHDRCVQHGRSRPA